MVSSTTDRPTTVNPQPDQAALIALATSVSQGIRASASRRRNQVLARSPSRSHGVRSETTNAAATMTAASTSHAVVVMTTGCGSGGGAPVGRRWRRVRWTGEPGGLGGIVVRSAFSLNAHPAPRDQRPRTPPPAHEIQRRSRIFGNKLDQAVNEGLAHEFAGAHGALGEVERSRRDSG
jgi:hypothetical protein